MALITKDNTFTTGTTIIASEHNANFNTIYNEVNGNLDNANIVSGAGIKDGKLAQITTPSKVSGAAITLLTSVPSGAGVLPDANGGLSTTTQTITGVKTFDSIPVLPSADPTTDDQAANKEYVDDKVVVAVGTAAHGATISLPAVPSGRSTGDYTWVVTVSINNIGTYTGGDGDNLQAINCSVDGSRVVTCSGHQRDNGTVTGTANYMIIGTLD